MEWQNVAMYFVGLGLIFLAIKKKYEPVLLLPLGFGTILMNLPGAACSSGIIGWLFETGIESSEALPILLFVGIGAMIDFTPLIQNPVLFFCGIFSQAGIFAGIGIAILLGFQVNDAISAGIIGAADGPTAILVSRALKSQYTGQITLAAYSYIALIPIIQPMVAKILVSKKERTIRANSISQEVQNGTQKPVSKTVKIIFPIAATFVSGFIAPQSAQLVGFIMFGNLVRECGVLDYLADTARTALTNLISLFLGITISFTMRGPDFIQPGTLLVLGIGMAAFFIDTAAGILFVKILNLFRKNKLNPLVGMAGISAFPTASHVAQKLAGEADSSNIIIMQAAAANVAGQICSAVIGGWLISMGG